MRVVFAGGGTGGHVYPALSVSEELKKRLPDFEAMFVGTKTGLEATVVPSAGYEIEFIFSRGVRGRGVGGAVLTLASLAVGFFQALRLLLGFKPDLVFGSGGYASAAVVFAAGVLRYRVVLQEQNSIPGLTNRMLASRAKRIYLGFERALHHFKGHPGLIVTGNPLRHALLEEGVMVSRTEFGLEERGPVLLVFGGSQGAHTLNRAAVEYLVKNREIQGILQTGKRDYDWVMSRLGGEGGRVFISPYIDDINLAYRVADVALARAGALSVCELAAVGLPAILVPYPYAADDHQVFNASTLVEAGGAVLIEDSDLDAETLGNALGTLLGNPERLPDMRKAMLSVARRDAASRIADDIVSLLAESIPAGTAGAAGAGGAG